MRLNLAAMRGRGKRYILTSQDARAFRNHARCAVRPAAPTGCIHCILLSFQTHQAPVLLLGSASAEVQTRRMSPLLNALRTRTCSCILLCACVLACDVWVVLQLMRTVARRRTPRRVTGLAGVTRTGFLGCVHKQCAHKQACCTQKHSAPTRIQGGLSHSTHAQAH